MPLAPTDSDLLLSSVDSALKLLQLTVAVSVEDQLFVLARYPESHNTMLAIRNALRSLRRSPAFAVVSILSLGLALGLVAMTFGLVDAMRHPRTAMQEPERLYSVRYFGEGAAGRVNVAEHIDVLQRMIPSAEAVAFQAFTRGDVLIAGETRLQASGWRVSTNYFSVLGVRPIAGRLFSDATANDDAVASVVISERLWHSVFEAEPRLERLAVTIEGSDETRRMQVVGVVPEELANEANANFWLAVPQDVRGFLARERSIYPILRLKTDATIEGLNTEFERAGEYLTSVHGTGRNKFGYSVRPMAHDALRVHDLAWLLVAAAIAVLVIACSNLANLVLARGLARQRDMAVRLSLGARRADIVKTVVVECVIVAIAGAALGLVAATWGFAALRTSMPENLPASGVFGIVISMNWRIALLSSGTAIVAALVFGLLPALRLSDLQLASFMKEQSGTTTSRHRARFPALVVGQVALSLVMLTGIALMLRASQEMQKVDFGFDPARLLEVYGNSRSVEDTTLETRLTTWAAMETRLREHPLTESVAWQRGVGVRPASITGERSGGATRSLYMTSYVYASPNILRTKGVSIIRGRDFEDHDAFGEGVVIVDSATALRIWGSEDPVGHLVKFAPDERLSPWFRVIGVSRPVLPGVPRFAGEETPSQVYLVGRTAFVPAGVPGGRPMRASIPDRNFVVRAAAANVTALRADIPRVLRDALPPRGYVEVNGFDDQRQALIARQRLLAQVFATFGLLSLTLCTIGLYSVLSYSVSRRLREHGIRVALGATPRDVFKDVLHEGALLVIAGTAVGGLATIWSNKLVDPYIGLIYHIDAIALIAAEVVLVGVALASMMKPALRATKTDPVEVLRAV